MTHNALFPNLERFLIKHAPPHVAVDNAPESLAELNRWLQYSPKYFDEGRFEPLFRGNCYREVGSDLVARIPVWNGASGRTIYSSAEVNYAYRAFHDHTHLRLQADVNLDDEFQVSCEQTRIARAWGLPDIEVRALWADSHGQNAYYKRHGKFVEDQRAFVLAYLAVGDHALNLEW